MELIEIAISADCFLLKDYFFMTPKGYLALVLHAHLPFVRHPEYDEFLEEDWFYEAITETYIPLINIDGWTSQRRRRFPFHHVGHAALVLDAHGSAPAGSLHPHARQTPRALP